MPSDYPLHISNLQLFREHCLREGGAGFMEQSFAEVHPELVCEWPEKNAPLKATDITYGSNKRYWWIGKCGHE